MKLIQQPLSFIQHYHHWIQKYDQNIDEYYKQVGEAFLCNTTNTAIGNGSGNGNVTQEEESTMNGVINTTVSQNDMNGHDAKNKSTYIDPNLRQFLGQLLTPHIYKIPSLNFHAPDQIPSRTIVKFHGFITDIYSTELYCDEKGQRSERLSIRLAHLPGETELSYEHSKSQHAPVNVGSPSPLPFIPTSNSLTSSILVTVYDTTSSILRMGEMVEVIGFYIYEEVEPMVPDEFGEFDDCMHGLPSLTPLIDCFSISSLLPSFPLLKTPEELNSALSTIQTNGKVIRQQLLEYLTVLCDNDKLCAEFILLNLISRIEVREMDALVGKLSLNLILPADRSAIICDRLTSFLANVLPRFLLQTITISSLNSSSFTPRKDYVKDMISPSPLQMPLMTHLLCDETKLTTGDLTPEGLANLQCLDAVLRTQQLSYDFQYNTIPMNQDVAAIIVSSQCKSILTADIRCPVLSMNAAHSIQLPLPTSEILNTWRHYFLTARASQVQFMEATSKWVEDYFVRARSQYPNLMNPQSLHTVLTMARLYSIGCGNQQITEHDFKYVTSLYDQLMERNSKATPTIDTVKTTDKVTTLKRPADRQDENGDSKKRRDGTSMDSSF